MAADIPHFVLNNGVKMPSIGIGCWMGEVGGGERAERMIRTALKLGYRHIDTAVGYGNEESIGRAVRESGIPREEVFITTKLANKHHGCVREGFELSLKALELGYIDLYLMHWPVAVIAKVAPGDRYHGTPGLRPTESPTFVETWLEMEKLLETGKVKSIGVSNFSVKNLEILLAKSNIIPAVNQVELHPCLPQMDLKRYCSGKGIQLTAYAPLGQPDQNNMQLLRDSTVIEIAQQKKASAGQILISWGVHRGTAVIPKSEREERIRENITLVKLSDDDMRKLNNINLKPGMHRSLLVKYYQDGKVFGWTFEEFGWKLDRDGFVQ